MGGWFAERLWGALRLGVQKALGVVSTHYIVDFAHLATGYIVPDGDADIVIDVMEQADAASKGAAATLAEHFEGDLFPGTDDDEEVEAPGAEQDAPDAGQDASGDDL